MSEPASIDDTLFYIETAVGQFEVWKLTNDQIKTLRRIAMLTLDKLANEQDKRSRE